MARRTAFWCGDTMNARSTSVRPKQHPSPGVRSITLLGATGSIGSSTIDLIKRHPERYRVEAISANRNGAALGKLAREINARFAVVSDPAAFSRAFKEVVGMSPAAWRRARGWRP